MSFNLEAMLQLGDVDASLNRLRRRLGHAPGLAAPQQQRVDAAKAELETLKDETKLNQREVTRLEGEATAKKGEIEKAQLALNQAKANEEYQTLLRTIDARQSELSDIETRILEAYEAQDERVEREKAGKTRLAQQEKELKAALGRVAEEEAACNKEIEELEVKRKSFASEISAEHLELYEKILQKTGDKATAEVVDEMCQGCYVKVRPQQISLVRAGTELVVCFTCARILYGRFE